MYPCFSQGAWRRQLETAAVVTSWFVLNITIASSTKWIFVHGRICLQDVLWKRNREIVMLIHCRTRDVPHINIRWLSQPPLCIGDVE